MMIGTTPPPKPAMHMTLCRLVFVRFPEAFDTRGHRQKMILRRDRLGSY
jgi:hypothetical protein